MKTILAAIAIAAIAAGCRTAGEVRVTVRDAIGCTVTIQRTAATQDAGKSVRDLADIAASVAAGPASTSGSVGAQPQE